MYRTFFHLWMQALCAVWCPGMGKSHAARHISAAQRRAFLIIPKASINLYLSPSGTLGSFSIRHSTTSEGRICTDHRPGYFNNSYIAQCIQRNIHQISFILKWNQINICPKNNFKHSTHILSVNYIGVT